MTTSIYVHTKLNEENDQRVVYKSILQSYDNESTNTVESSSPKLPSRSLAKIYAFVFFAAMLLFKYETEITVAIIIKKCQRVHDSYFASALFFFFFF